MADLVDEATDRGRCAAVRALGHRDFWCIALVVLVAGLAQPVFQLVPVFADDGFLDQLPVGRVPAIACCGAAFLGVVSTLNTTVQLPVEERSRGRVMALYVMAFTAAYPIGALLQGAIADAVGVRATVTGAGVLVLLVTLAARLTPVFDRLDRRRS